VVRTLLAEVGGESYAFPLAYISRTLSLPREQIEMLEGRQLFEFEGRPVGLVDASQVLGGTLSPASAALASIIVIGESANSYGLVVDRFLGERELVVRPLDIRLGKVKDIAAAALMEDGSPVLIIDVEDLRQSVEKLISTGRLNRLPQGVDAAPGRARKRVLVVDDSLTVRELERKLLDSHGYEIEVAVNGMEGWNAVRTGNFDLVITDIDMPRMDGIELVSLIRKDPSLKSLPVMIVSYKDREEDRRRGLEAGADYYLTKGSFHDDALVRAVVDLIGEAVT
jgi:two-component system, chemotaxis family, sensor histidine kinase and response regulator WspE